MTDERARKLRELLNSPPGPGYREKVVLELLDERDRLREALAFYADPGTYHAVAFLFDRPCGGFEEDFSRDHGDDFYERSMPGKTAREALSPSPAPRDVAVGNADE